ncbi:MAG TPA: FtsX-like permease family protein [Drouetiella sp.]|jgi:putative ABC transport system permease protein
MFFELSLFRRFILRDLAKNKTRTSLTLAGIALGVSVLIAISLANHTALIKFKETVDLVSGKANLEIRSTAGPFMDQNALVDLSWLGSIGGKYMPMIQQTVAVADKDEELVQIIGIDMLGDPDFKSYDEESSGSNSFLDLFSSRSVLIGDRLAKTLHLSKGSSFKLLINDRSESFIVSEVMSGEGLGGVYSGNLVVGDLNVVQRALNAEGKISQVEIIVPESLLEQAQFQLRQELPADITIDRPSQRGEQVEKMTRSFKYNLIALTFIALMVGMFLIYNTMTISVIRRRPEIGTMRALGVSRVQIMSLFLIESLWFGVVGTTIGLVMGLVMSQGALKAIAGTFQHFYFQTPMESVTMAPQVLVAAFLLGVLLTVLASIPPVIEATGVAPAEATRRASYESKIERLSPALSALGLLFFAGAAIASVQQPVYNFPVYGYVAALAAIIGSALMMPLALRFSLPALGAIFRKIFGFEGLFAARSLHGTLGRTSVAVASLMIGIAMMVSLGIMIGSFRETVMVWIDQTLQADLWLQSSARAAGSRFGKFDQSLVPLIRSVPNVIAVDAFVDTPIEYKGEQTNLGAGDLDVTEKYGHLKFTSGEPTRAVLARMGRNSAIVSESFAIRKHVKTGDTIVLQTPAGDHAVKIEGVYYNYASDLGYIVIPRQVYKDLYHEAGVSNCAIYLAPGADPYAVRTEIQKRLAKVGLFSIRTTSELRKEAIKIFDRTFAITYALHTIAIAVSMLAVMNALFALALYSRREFGILRYMGASKKQIQTVVLTEAGILGVLGNVSGLALGFVLSLLLIFVINKQSFGWTVQFAVPYDFLLEASVLVLLTSILSGIIPARFAAKTLAPQVVREE